MKSQSEKNGENFFCEEGFKVVKVATDADLFNQIGNKIHFDIVDYEEVANFVIQKHSSFRAVMDLVMRRFHVEVYCQRFWLFEKWQNCTSPLNRLLTPLEKEETVEKLSTKFQNADIKLFLEVPPRKDFVPMSLLGEEILLFFKLYAPEKKKCWYVGKMFVPDIFRPVEIVRKLNECVGFASHQQIHLYEEMQCLPTSMCQPLDKMKTFQYSKLVNGSILWFQKQSSQYHRLLRYPDVPSFFEHIHNCKEVQFRSQENPDKNILVLEISKNDTYVQVVCKVAKKLGMDDPSTIWLTAHCKCPLNKPTEFRQGLKLLEMLVPDEEKSDILYIEVKEIPLPGWECLHTLKVSFLANLWDEGSIYHISLPKESIVADLIDEMKEKVQLPHPTADLRLLQVVCNKIYKIYSASERVEFITDQCCSLRVEEIPKEEKELGPQDLLIHVCHFKLEADDQIKNFGEPFLLVIKDGETLGQVKIRIQTKLQVQAEESSKWKFAYVRISEVQSLMDGYILSNWFQTPNISDSLDQYLGIEHSNSTDMVDPSQIL